QVGARDERRSDGEGVADIVDGAAAYWQQGSRVIVADVRQPSAVVGEQACGESEAAHGLLECRGGRVLRNPRDGERQQVKVEGVAMVVRRPLAVAAVRRNLAIDLVDENPAALLG